jgi:phospholipase C
VPQGDVLHQFRRDVNEGKLPAVSWLASPKAFSDHPSSAWFGSWYISEVLNILTHNPEVWRKTVFILTYDENDGYFDHVPPFVAPHPRRPETGRVTRGIDAGVEYIEREQDQKRAPAGQGRDGPIGLGYRVPMIIASPWSRGGCVCSQVFDHTSVLRFLETLLTHKTGRKVEEPNISRWRRAVCGDLTSAFQSPEGDKDLALPFQTRDAFIEEIDRAQFKELPGGYHVLTAAEIEQIRRDPRAPASLPGQESGVRRSCPLPYELLVDGSLNEDRSRFAVRLEARRKVHGDRSAGSAFIAYALQGKGKVAVRNYAVEPGEHLDDSWPVADFEGGIHHLRVYGPNGFFREFIGDKHDPKVTILFDYSRSAPGGRELTSGVEITATNQDPRQAFKIDIRDNAYGKAFVSGPLSPGERVTRLVDTRQSFGWYDVSVRTTTGGRFEQRYAGRVEDGKCSTSDPAMGRVDR